MRNFSIDIRAECAPRFRPDFASEYLLYMKLQRTLTLLGCIHRLDRLCNFEHRQYDSSMCLMASDP